MNNFQIEIKPTNHKSIVKFEANHFLTQHESFEFANIEEAKNSPIAQQLFHLPFVKKVFIAQNFVAIEKYDIVSWENVQEETATQIENHLNQGGIVIKSEASEREKNIAVTVYAESTPNPSVMKFVSNKKLALQPSEFKNIDATKNSPLAQALFHFPFVKEVFFDENYVSINKYDIAQWNDITIELREFIRNYLQEKKPVLQENKEPAQAKTTYSNAETNKNLDGTSKEIIAILDEYIKPAVASDGGNIVFESYNPQNKIVKVVLQGACSGCPSSTLTLKNGIETMLKELLHEKVERVEAING